MHSHNYNIPPIIHSHHKWNLAKPEVEEVDDHHLTHLKENPKRVP
jgi:hypothetical protein